MTYALLFVALTLCRASSIVVRLRELGSSEQYA
jgi:hypothetical protein